jgi:hypothetical protein
MSTNNRILINKSRVAMNHPPLVIGRGAMGEVYKATYQGKDVVVKKSQVGLKKKQKKTVFLINKLLKNFLFFFFFFLFCSGML